MDNLKLYGINFGAIFLTIVPDINQSLQTILLLLTIAYTGIQIYNKLNGKD